MKTFSRVVSCAVVAMLLGACAAAPTTKNTETSDTHVGVVLSLMPEKPVARQETALNFAFTDANGNPETGLMKHHGRAVHVVLVSTDGQTVGHIHPEDFGEAHGIHTNGTASVRYTFPQDGSYLVAVDAMNEDGAFSSSFMVHVGEGTPTVGRIDDLPRTACFTGTKEEATDMSVRPVDFETALVPCPQGYEVTMGLSSETVTVGEAVRLSFHVEKEGKHVTTLVPYLEAGLHLAIVPETFDRLMHRHGLPVEMNDGESHENHDEIQTDTSSAVTEADPHAMHDMANMDAMDHGSMEEDDGHNDGMTGHSHDVKLPATFGPHLESEPLVFEVPGTYVVLAQFKDGDVIVTVRFSLTVEPSFDAASAHTVDAMLMERTWSPETVDVTQGEKIVLRVHSDEDGDIHLHGYDITHAVVAGEKTELRFEAANAGRYSIEFHPASAPGTDIELGALVVQPR